MAENLHPLVHVLYPHNMQVSGWEAGGHPLGLASAASQGALAESCMRNVIAAVWTDTAVWAVGLTCCATKPAQHMMQFIMLPFSILCLRILVHEPAPHIEGCLHTDLFPCCTQTLLGPVREIVYGKAWSKFHKGQWKRGRCWQCCLGSAKHVSGLQGGLVPGVWHGVSQMLHSYRPKQVLSSATVSAWLLCFIYIFKFSQVVLSFLVLWKSFIQRNAWEK